MIFYVEDDQNIRGLTLYALEKAGIAARGFCDAEEFFAACEQELPQCVLLDIMLPGVDGLEILHRLRQDPKTDTIPVMMLTAKGTELDKVVGLDGGADDYLTKPFGMMELVSRVNALLRRAALAASENETTVLGPISINHPTRTVSVKGKPCVLTLKEFNLLALLASHPGRVMSREQIMRSVWETEFMGATRTVDVHVLSLRQKLEATDPSASGCIRTVRGIGYKAVAPAVES